MQRSDRVVEELLPPGREEVSWAVALLVIARLCAALT
jgi:hypothetical protein